MAGPRPISIFEGLGERLAARLARRSSRRIRASARGRRSASTCASPRPNPELFRLMVDEGNVADERMTWLVDRHLRPRFALIAEGLMAVAEIDETLVPHAFYALAGAASLMFAVAPECRRLTGLDPHSAPAIERHADYVARLLVP